MLTGNEIMQRMAKGDIIIYPFNEKQLNPNSYNLKLGTKMKTYRNVILDMKKQNLVEEFEIPAEGIVLKPGIVYLAETEEFTETHNLIPCIDGRSSVARLGIKVHLTAGFGDIGFKGRWTLEIEVTHPVRVYPGVEICQIHYHEPNGEIITTYNGKYQNQNGVVESRMQEDWK